MCGRARCTLDPDTVARTTRVPRDRWVRFEDYRPSYNLAPGAATPVVVAGPDGERSVQVMRWGLIPSFTKHDDKPDFFRMFNARSESVTQKSTFRRLVPRRRCVVLMNGFFEWREEHGRKQPYYVHLKPLGGADGGAEQESSAAAAAANSKDRPSGAADGDAVAEDGKQQQQGQGERQQQQQGQRQQQQQGQGEQQQGEQQEQQGQQPVMRFAGLWDVWPSPQGPLHSYTVLTTPASGKLAWLHDRMPALLPTREAEDAWLGAGELSQSDVERLATPYDGADLAWHPVTQRINTTKYQAEDACDEVKPPKAITAFFRPAAAAAAPKGDAAAAATPGGTGPAGDGGAKEAAAAGIAAAVKAEGDGAAGSGSNGSSSIKAQPRDANGGEAAHQAGPHGSAAATATVTAAAQGAGEEVKREPCEASAAAAAEAADEFACGGPSTSKASQQQQQQQQQQVGGGGGGSGGSHKAGVKRGPATPPTKKSPAAKKAKSPGGSGKGQMRLDAFFSKKM